MNQLNRFKLITSIRWLSMNDFKEKSSQLLSISSSFFSTSPKALSSSYFRTKECDPSKHQEIHNGLFYQIPKEASNRLFLFGGFDKDIQSTLNVFQEMCIMVRKPAIDVINLLNRTDFNQPPNFYVLCMIFGMFEILNNFLVLKQMVQLDLAKLSLSITFFIMVFINNSF
ncbi:BUB3-interacting and GLEBS motif-containing protein [Sarcoptes scabiei]|nr:BUB3-interacting and GLEBS motif-containing protein [Sarcoptes scabiei]